MPLYSTQTSTISSSLPPSTQKCFLYDASSSSSSGSNNTMFTSSLADRLSQQQASNLMSSSNTSGGYFGARRDTVTSLTSFLPPDSQYLPADNKLNSSMTFADLIGSKLTTTTKVPNSATTLSMSNLNIKCFNQIDEFKQQMLNSTVTNSLTAELKTYSINFGFGGKWERESDCDKFDDE